MPSARPRPRWLYAVLAAIALTASVALPAIPAIPAAANTGNITFDSVSGDGSGN